MAVKVPHRQCGAVVELEAPGLGHPDACPDCGSVLSTNELLSDAVEASAEDERAEEGRVRLDSILNQRQILPH